jgi:hypothetical protein
MSNDTANESTWLSDISRHLGPIFRHTFPGVLLVGGARLAYPERFCHVHIDSWQHVLVLAVVTVTAGNALFAFNRFGLHQLVEYFLYRGNVKGPVPNGGNLDFFEDMAEYVIASFRRKDLTDIRQHIAFRVSSIFLLLTLAETSLAFSFSHSDCSIFSGNWIPLVLVGVASLAAYIYQLWLTRRIDYFFVTKKQPNQKEYPDDEEPY